MRTGPLYYIRPGRGGGAGEVIDDVDFIDVAGIRTAYREWPGRGAAADRTVLCLHGYPTSSYLWRAVAPVMTARAHVIAPDLPGFGDSELGPCTGTWEELAQFVDDFVGALDLAPVDLMVHDWGGLAGLWWLTEHPEKVRTLIITDTGFFSDGRWHAFAKTYRIAGAGEALIDAMTEEGMGGMLRGACPAMPDDALAEYWKSHNTLERRAAKLAMYRSGDFEKLAEREWKLGEVAPPTCIIWGAHDMFAPVGGGHRFHKRIPKTEMHILQAGHFLQEEEPTTVGQFAADFLRDHEPG